MSRLKVLLVLAGASSVFAQDLHLKSRTLRSDELIGSKLAVPLQAGHRILQFDHTPGAEDLDALVTSGNPVVGVLPDNGVVVTTPDGTIGNVPGIRWIGVLDPADKMSSELPEADTIAAIIEFHPDVTSAQQDQVASAEGVTLERVPVLAGNHAIAETSMDQLKAMAAHDEVAYVFPADADLVAGGAFNTCAGMMTASGPIPQFANIIHGWDADQDHVVRLGYVFGSVTPKVPAATVESEIVRALTEWSKNINLTFQPGSSLYAPRTVVVKFASGAHGDAYPFDGPGGILAHTFYPVPVNAESIAGDMHMDADENWHAGGDLDIYSVALHEAGHAIGLSHSDKPGDVMYPYYKSGKQLSANDIGAAQVLYGPPSGASTATPVSAPITTAPASLRLSVDPVAATAASSTATLTGTVTGGVPPITVQWQTNHGYGGQAIASGNGWMARQVPLVNGENAVSVTAFDYARQTSTQTQVLTLSAPAATGQGNGGAPVSVSIKSPASTVTTANTATIAVSGTAAGGQGVSRVAWQTSGGASGTAVGTSPWSVSELPLLPGTNTVVVRAYDSKGNSGWATFVVVRH